MKTKLLIFMLLTMLQIQGFGQADTVKEKTVYNALLRSNMIFQTFGEWSVSATFLENAQIRGMVCPIITFSDNLTATIKNCAKEKESYKWTIKSDTLHLEYMGDPQKDHYFTAPTYKMVFKDHETYLELKLYTTETSGYILHKKNR